MSNLRLRQAAQQALEALGLWATGHDMDAVALNDLIAGLEDALEQYDKDRVRIEELKANWALQRKLAEETQERDKQRLEYEAALSDGDNLSPTEPEPLTYEQLAKLGNDIVCLWDPPKWGMSELWEASLVEFGRAVEAAHGINAPRPGSDGCDHCRHPLYAAIKCSQCGRVTE